MNSGPQYNQFSILSLQMLLQRHLQSLFSSIPGIDAMLQKFLKVDVLVDFICNNDFRIFF
jgi:hypothetical protein